MFNKDNAKGIYFVLLIINTISLGIDIGAGSYGIMMLPLAMIVLCFIMMQQSDKKL